jgi:GNAT superfamily N-acetyltransferase
LAQTVVKLLDAAIGGEQGVAEGIPVEEQINYETLKRFFNKQKDMGWYILSAHGDWASRPADDPPTMEIFAELKPEPGKRNGKQIGHLSLKIAKGQFLRNNPGAEALVASSVEVEPAYERKGVGTSMYQFARELGNDVIASIDQSDDAKALWASMRAKGVAETINPAVRNKRFVHTQVIGDYTYKASVEWFIGSPLLYIKAYDGDKQIGEVMFEIITRSPGGKRDPSADYLESGGTEVEPEYRNKGVASTMYAYAKMLGNDIVPSDNQRPDGKAMWAAWEKSGDAKHLIGTAAESTIAEGPIVSRIVHPRKINIYVRSGINKPPVLVATDIPYEILDRYIAKVISKYPRFKATDFSFKPSDKVSENQGWAATYEALKPDAFNALQQAKQRIEQDRQQEISQWEQDFRANTAARFAPRSRPAAPAPAPVAQPGEKHAVLKARISQLDQAIKKQQQLDALSQKLEYKGLLTPAMQQDLDTRMYVRDAAADNYQALNQKLDRAIEIATTRLRTNKLAFRENADYIEEANKQ